MGGVVKRLLTYLAVWHDAASEAEQDRRVRETVEHVERSARGVDRLVHDREAIMRNSFRRADARLHRP